MARGRALLFLVHFLGRLHGCLRGRLPGRRGLGLERRVAGLDLDDVVLKRRVNRRGHRGHLGVDGLADRRDGLAGLGLKLLREDFAFLLGDFGLLGQVLAQVLNGILAGAQNA